ncbi:magnesium transporter CorA family protein [Conexibacter sp. SYSU D00693]|uniref:magnesium transporter CorA family protein n=1 Tax=Conexibacter sp. SYSU D00693 TaxID=2812560 RepID=UPI00196B3D59|nr:magnesium transporter CorA family protein [Conexibacter sp. SYSU D00693]
MLVLDRPEPDRLRELLARDEFFWLDLHGATEEELADVGQLLELPGLALEDSQEMHQRPKLDDYGRAVLLVFYGVDARCGLVEVHLHISGDFLLTVRDSTCSHLEAVKEEAARRDDATEEGVVALVLDALTDSFTPALDAVEGDVEELEDALLGRPTVAQRRALLDRRNDLGRLRQRAIAQRELLEQGKDVIHRVPGLESEGEDELLRDVHDHLVVVGQRCERLLAQLASALELHLSLVGARQNEVVERLTLVSTIFLPLSVLTGFFGMNFGWLVDHIDPLWAFLVYGLGGMTGAVCVLLLYLRHLRRAE